MDLRSADDTTLMAENEEEMICVCVWIFWWAGREGCKEVGTWMGRDVVSQEQREQTLRSPVSQRAEVSTWSGVCTECEYPCLTIDLSGKE